MKHVLIIEDDEKIQQFLHSILTEVDNSFYLHVSPSAAQALEIANTHEISLFFIDIQLTDYKGTDLANELRALHQYKYTPMIFATAIVTEELRAYREIKCYDYLIKPFTRKEVKQAVYGVLDYMKHVQINHQTVRFEQKGFIFEYRMQDIVYIESYGKKMIVHLKTTDGIFQENLSGYSLKAIHELLKEGPFQQIHKSYIINKDYVESISKAENTIKLQGHSAILPIGQKYRDVLMKAGR